jgi:myo-inositol-1-phosphate synthase
MAKVGVWIVGASGSVATTAMAGANAVAKGISEPVGLVTTLPEFSEAGFCDLKSLVFGGHEVRKPDLLGELRDLNARSGVVPERVIDGAKSLLRTVTKRIRPGTTIGCGEAVEQLADLERIRAKTAAGVVARIRTDLEEFVAATRCKHLVVVDLSSTEPPFPEQPCHASLAELRPAMKQPGEILPASSLYAFAALELGAAFINFTPSLGAKIPALVELAEECGGLIAGCDGKTGETLCKSVIAPLFAMRNLRILSWVGHNIFGNRDADVLDDPRNKASKVKSKDHLIQQIVGYSPSTLVTIEKIPSMCDWKTAWDHVHFEGFLGTKMIMQFIWQGCDSLLAAPLVLDLVRLAVLAQQRGDAGILRHAACFFKSPIGVDTQDMFEQFQMLLEYAADPGEDIPY